MHEILAIITEYEFWVTIFGWFVAFYVSMKLNARSHRKNLELQERIFKHEIKNKTYLDIQKAIKNYCDELLDIRHHLQGFEHYLEYPELKSLNFSQSVQYYMELLRDQGKSLYTFQKSIYEKHSVLNEKNTTFISIYESNEIVFPEFVDKKDQIKQENGLLTLFISIELMEKFTKDIEVPANDNRDFCEIIRKSINQTTIVHNSLQELERVLQNNFLGAIFKKHEYGIKGSIQNLCQKGREWIQNLEVKE